MRGAPCAQVGTEAMFPAPSNSSAVALAKRVCALCDVRLDCLEWALAPESRCEFGVFGGLTESERKDMIKVRNLGKATRLFYGPRPPAERRIPATS
jgi:hypothetical protein